MRWGKGLIPLFTLCPHLCNKSPVVGDTLTFISSIFTPPTLSQIRIIVVIRGVKKY